MLHQYLRNTLFQLHFAFYLSNQPTALHTHVFSGKSISFEASPYPCLATIDEKLDWCWDGLPFFESRVLINLYLHTFWHISFTTSNCTHRNPLLSFSGNVGVLSFGFHVLEHEPPLHGLKRSVCFLVISTWGFCCHWFEKHHSTFVGQLVRENLRLF